MSDVTSTNALQDPYCVQRGDTLSKIATRSGRSVAELKRFNSIRNANQLEVGQTLFLSDHTAFGASILFLDALRHPIQNLRYRIEFDGRERRGSTGTDGLIPKFVTENAQSQIKVWIHDIDGAWHQVAHVTSDYGHKLVTLTSNAVVVAGQTRQMAADALHDLKSSLQVAMHRLTGPQASPPEPAKGADSKNNPAVKTQQVKGPKGQPVIKVEVDIPQGLVALFSRYNGHEIAESDWQKAADKLECEVEVLKAFSVVESGGKSSFWRLNKADGAYIPAILFERHYFSRLTKGKFDSSHPDVSWPVAYRKKNKLGQEDKSMHDGKVVATDVYSDFASAYLRLINAYRLDPDAALRSCSWGKFQIMGDNCAACGESDVQNFIQKMCTSEYQQIELLASFVRAKPAPWKDARNKKAGKAPSLWEAIKSKDWAMIAFNYNGPSYSTFHYDTQLKAAYEHLKSARKA
ncbi:N-acetylmuramidase domain-containing protein [Aquabacterium sp.]|uniref:LysM peptidoglycan-binding domain-containing protein n=1 Tax=Aquabacterium sp. TaxID=1872578 RepID=UPI0035B05ADB